MQIQSKQQPFIAEGICAFFSVHSYAVLIKAAKVQRALLLAGQTLIKKM